MPRVFFLTVFFSPHHGVSRQSSSRPVGLSESAEATASGYLLEHQHVSTRHYDVVTDRPLVNAINMCLRHFLLPPSPFFVYERLTTATTTARNPPLTAQVYQIESHGVWIPHRNVPYIRSFCVAPRRLHICPYLGRCCIP